MRLPATFPPAPLRRLHAVAVGTAAWLAGGVLPAPVMGQAALPQPPAAQSAALTFPVLEPGSEEERYLRTLHLSGQLPLSPWTLRPFSPAAEARFVAEAATNGPWASRIDAEGTPDLFSEVQLQGIDLPAVRLLPMRVRTAFNSHFPYGPDEGALWLGKGLSTEVRAGLSGEWGPVSFSLLPSFSWVQNRDFTFTPVVGRTRGPVIDWRYHRHNIDLPQSPEDGAFARLHPGHSYVRLDKWGTAIGFSSSRQGWGPADQHPLILGTNAPGFLHGFLGTSDPVDIWIGHFQGRVFWGRLDQTDLTSHRNDPRRFASGLVVSLAPRGVPGLEVGAGRFFQEEWREGGLGGQRFARPIEAFYKATLRDRYPDPTVPDRVGLAPSNQLVSLFFRWAFPSAGLELFGEWGREDHAFNFRDLVLSPDNQSAYMLGFRKSWEMEGNRILAVRSELISSRASHPILVRPQQATFFFHYQIRQGHTHDGKVLGSPYAYGGGGSVVALDRYDPGGRWSLAWTRELREDRYHLVRDVPDIGVGPNVRHGLGVDAVRFLGRFDLEGGALIVGDLNRNLSDLPGYNLRFNLGLRSRF